MKSRECDTRLVARGDQPGHTCIDCGNVSDLKGDPRRGFCLVNRHMVGAGLTGSAWTDVHWTDRLPELVR